MVQNIIKWERPEGTEEYIYILQHEWWTTCYVSHAHIVQILKRTWCSVKENYSTQLKIIILKGLYIVQGPSQRLKLGMFKFNLAVVRVARELSAGRT